MTLIFILGLFGHVVAVAKDFDYHPEKKISYSPGGFFTIDNFWELGDEIMITVFSHDKKYKSWSLNWANGPSADPSEISLHLNFQLENAGDWTHPQHVIIDHKEKGEFAQPVFVPYPQKVMDEDGNAQITYWMKVRNDSKVEIAMNFDNFKQVTVSDFVVTPARYLIISAPCFSVLRYYNVKDEKVYSYARTTGMKISYYDIKQYIKKLDTKLPFDILSPGLQLAIQEFPTDHPGDNNVLTSCFTIPDVEREYYVIWGEYPMQPFQDRDVGLAIKVFKDVVNVFSRANGTGNEYAVFKPPTKSETHANTFCLGFHTKVVAKSIHFMMAVWRGKGTDLQWQEFKPAWSFTARYGPGIGFTTKTPLKGVVTSRFKSTQPGDQGDVGDVHYYIYNKKNVNIPDFESQWQYPFERMFNAKLKAKETKKLSRALSRELRLLKSRRFSRRHFYG